MIDLAKFCSAGRKNIATPWSAGEYSYATNGHILVRVPRRDDISERTDAPGVSKLFAMAAPAHEMRPMPHLPPVPMTQCTPCRGIGYLMECRSCDGRGDVTCHACKNNASCTACDGDGLVAGIGDGAEKCLECDGEGKHPEVSRNVSVFMARGFVIDLRYAQWIAELPNATISWARNGIADHRPVPFKFDGGDGLLMPISSAVQPRDGIDIVMYDDTEFVRVS